MKTINDLLNLPDGRYVRDLVLAQCNDCQKVIVCTIISEARQAKPGKLIRGLVVEGQGRENRLDNACLRCLSWLPMNKGLFTAKRKLPKVENMTFWGNEEFESHEDYLVRHAE